MIKKFFIEDVRCFAGRHELNIRPLTFLVGENSTGKSTILGAYQVMSNFIVSSWDHFNGAVDFNSDPYQMGTFDDIARKGAQTACMQFVLGVEVVMPHTNSESYTCLLTYSKKAGTSELCIKRLQLIFKDGALDITAGEAQGDTWASEVTATNNNNFTVVKTGHIGRKLDDTVALLLAGVSQWMDRNNASAAEQAAFTQFTEEHRLLQYGGRRESSGIVTRSIGPVRSKPKRTYEPILPTIHLDGSGIPIFLHNVHMSDKKEWDRLSTALNAFGEASGLFSNVTLRQLGDGGADPFQLQLEIRGAKSNIKDVGYGVSQVLPILVRVLMGRGTTFLMQQPEVHLHPKGQAALTSLLVSMTNQRQNSFVIESHSDYMINRARIEIMQGRIAPEDVALIYLEPEGDSVQVHNISFDAQGNMIGVPPGYRDFFLQESHRLLGFDN